MSGSAPKVSVCVPAYNAAPYLPAALDSVLAQTFGDFELIVSDDASRDETPEICARYTDPRFQAVRSEERLGQAGNWNRCVELASGEYVILLHADDELLPLYLEQAVAVLDANPDVGLFHCSVRHIDEAGNPGDLQQLFDADTIDRDELTLRHLLLDGCVISPAGVTVRRTIYDRVGEFTDQIVWGVDWHMWIRIALDSPIAYLNKPLARYREHGTSGTTSVMSSGRNARDEMWMMNDIFSLIGRTRPDLAELKPQAIHGVAHRTWCFAESMCELGEMNAARVGVRNAVRIWPAMARQPKVWGLWAATYTGYRWFATAHSVRQSVARRLRRAAPAAE